MNSRRLAGLTPFVLCSTIMFASPLAHVVLGNEPLRSIAEILALDAKSAAEELPVELEATVYYFDASWRVFFVAQGDDFICVTDGQEYISPGSVVKLSGRTASGKLNHLVRFESASVLETSELDSPVSISFKGSSLAEYDCRWVVGECDVLTARVDAGQTTLRCQSGDFQFDVCTAVAMPAKELLNLIGSKIRVTGVLCCDIEEDRVVGMKLRCSLDDVEVIESSATPIEYRERTSVKDTWNDEAARSFHLFGQVTFTNADGLFVENSYEGTWITNDQSIALKVGEFVELYGSRSVDGGLALRIVEASGSDVLLQPDLVSSNAMMTLRPESRRIRVQATLLRVKGYNQDTTVLEMKGDDSEDFVVYSSIGADRLRSLHLETAVKLTVTGTVSFARQAPYAYAIYSPAEDGLFVTQRAAVLSRANAFALLLTLAPLVAFLGYWGFSHRKKARSRKKDVEKLTAELLSSFESIRDGILIVDRDNAIVHANSKVREFAAIDMNAGDPAWRFEESLRLSLVDKEFMLNWKRLSADDLVSEEFVVELMTSGKCRVLEVSTAPVKNSAGVPQARLWTFHDVTEKEQLQASLLHSQKQEAIGRLAGGFAHDFNNLLTGITGNLSLASLDEEKTVADVQKFLSAAAGASDRAATLVSQLLGFSRKTVLDLKPNDVNRIIRKMEQLLRPVVGSDDAIAFDLAEQLPPVQVDATQLEQVLLNICLNACDAIRHHGSIYVKTRREKVARHGSDLPCVVVSIRDTGTGIAEEIQANVFEPFFTTKKGQGTGLGLAMAEGIVHQHDGWIELASEVGVGSEFRVFLPACNESIDHTPESKGDSNQDLTGQVLLVVDDEEVVRDAITAILQVQGATVLAASDGAQALACVEAEPNIDLVLLDWTMPGLSGLETLQRMRALDRDLPVVVCSGFVFDLSDIAEQASIAPNGVLQKPFSLEKLVETISNVLDGNR